MEVVFKALLEADVEPIVFVDDQHVVRYMNSTALKKYEKNLVAIQFSIATMKSPIRS